MEYGNAQIGSQYPEMKKSAEEMVNDLGSATAAKLNTQEILNAAAAKVAERLNANVSAAASDSSTDGGASDAATTTEDSQIETGEQPQGAAPTAPSSPNDAPTAQ